MGKYIIISRLAIHTHIKTRCEDLFPNDSWLFLDTLDEVAITAFVPDKIFFTRWSDVVPDVVVNTYECIAFHPTPLPYGRGGTPYQNMILLGHTDTKMSAFRMTTELDAGPIYLQTDLSLLGNLTEILDAAADEIVFMVAAILKYNIQPHSQEGEVVTFTQLPVSIAELDLTMTFDELYDIIRMLDANDFIRAWKQVGDLKFTFGNIDKLSDTKLRAVVEITEWSQ
jgi:methionyl-tRNA formyltransferase